jgi:hypothetical protein
MRRCSNWIALSIQVIHLLELLGRYPELLPIFLHHGFKPLANPALRRTVARVVTIEQVCRRESVDLDAFLQELRSSIAAAKRPAVLPS